jgi:signal transduction histidine kinase
LVAQLIEDIEVSATMDAKDHSLELTVFPVTNDLAVHGDPQILASVLSNLLQNAFKFTRTGGHVSLRTTSTSERVMIEVEDQCGGLPPGQAEELFQPFVQRGVDRTGLGLGLAISRRGAEASGGQLYVRNLPEAGACSSSTCRGIQLSCRGWAIPTDIRWRRTRRWLRLRLFRQTLRVRPWLV